MSRRSIFEGLLALFLGTVMAFALGYAWVQTAEGKRWLADRVEAAVRTPEFQMTIGTLDGAIPFAPSVTEISLSDSEGIWLTLDRASIRLDPLALLDRLALFDVIDVGRVTMRRRPVSSSSEIENQPTVPTTWPVAWPELPVDVEIKRLKVADVVLGAPILGEAASFNIEGAVRFGDLADGVSLDLTAARTDGSIGNLSALLGYVPDATRLITKMVLNEPEGDLLARLAGLPGLPALSVELVGDGTLDDWQATLRIDGGDDLKLEGVAAIFAEGIWRRVAVDATADWRPSPPRRCARLSMRRLCLAHPCWSQATSDCASIDAT